MSTDLDRRVAEIAGWTRKQWERGGEEFVFDGARIRCPSSSCEDAIAALEAMREKGWEWTIYQEPLRYVVSLEYLRDERIVSGAYTQLPLAICKAIVATEEGK